MNKNSNDNDDDNEDEEDEEASNRIKYRPLAEFKLKSMWLFSNTNPIRKGMYKVKAWWHGICSSPTKRCTTFGSE